jgi:hypothetical protein
MLKEPVKDIHSLMYHSLAVISSGDSMAREGAMLGIPGIYCGFRQMKALNLLIEKGMLFQKKPAETAAFIKQIVDGEIMPESQDLFRDRLWKEWDDVTEFLIRIITKK